MLENFRLEEWIVNSKKKYITCLNARYAATVFANMKVYAKTIQAINLVEVDEKARQEAIKQIVKAHNGSLPTRVFASPTPNVKKYNVAIQMQDQSRVTSRLCIAPFYVSGLNVDDRRQFFEYTKMESCELIIIDRVVQSDKLMDVSYWLHEVKLRYGEILSFRMNETHEAILIYAKSKNDWRASDTAFANVKDAPLDNNNEEESGGGQENELTRTRRRVLAKSKSSLE